MHVRLLAVGDRQPSWVNQAFSDYERRLPRQWRFTLIEIAAGNRGGSSSATDAKRKEGEKILQKITPAEWMVALDEHGRQFSSQELGTIFEEWQAMGRDIAFVIGGADGLSERCLARANLRWSLSKLTLPHGLARVLFAEQLYRAWSLMTGHPYHRV